MVRVTGLDHIVLRTTEVERSLAWYTTCLGLEALRVDEWRRGEAPFPSVRIDANTIIDIQHGSRDGTNVDHLCLVVDADLPAVAESGSFQVVDGPDGRWGARGTGLSLYVLDPDGNTVELRVYA